VQRVATIERFEHLGAERTEEAAQEPDDRRIVVGNQDAPSGEHHVRVRTPLTPAGRAPGALGRERRRGYTTLGSRELEANGSLGTSREQLADASHRGPRGRQDLRAVTEIDGLGAALR